MVTEKVNDNNNDKKTPIDTTTKGVRSLHVKGVQWYFLFSFSFWMSFHISVF